MIEDKVENEYPKLFIIVATLAAPEWAKEEDVRIAIRHRLMMFNIISVEEIIYGEERR